MKNVDYFESSNPIPRKKLEEISNKLHLELKILQEKGSHKSAEQIIDEVLSSFGYWI